MSEAAHPIETNPKRSRRAILAGALSGLAGLLGGRMAQPEAAAAASGDTLILGSTGNSAGTSNTSLTTSSTGTALLVTQNGSGTALRGSAVGAGSIAGFFTAQNGTGISGVTGNPNSYGVFAQNNGAAGAAGAVRAAGGNNHGVVGTSNNADRYGVKGQAPGTGVYGEATSLTGQTAGVFGATGGDIGSAGVLGLGSGNAVGLWGIADARPAVVGVTTSGSGVYGESVSGPGAYGQSATGAGVHGFSESQMGIFGATNTGSAGSFVGNVEVLGTLSKSGGAFKIDHPLDPARKYLSHSFVESPDMKNIYDGVVTLDAKGEATVALPGYFETLNRDLRYQLTALGAAAPDLHVKMRVAKARFRIAGGTAGQEVCWQVTGIRQDPFAEAHRIVVEEAKPEAERGLFLHPELHGQPKEKGLHWKHRPKELRPAS
jgi:hypothetical protein